DEIERIGGQIVTQGDVGGEFLDSDTKMLSDKASNMRFDEFVHVPPSRARQRNGTGARTNQWRNPILPRCWRPEYTPNRPAAVEREPVSDSSPRSPETTRSP